MNTKTLIIAITLFVLAGVLLSIALLGPSILNNSAGIGTVINAAPTATTGNAIVRENANSGSSSWMIPVNRESKTQIQAYASATSIDPGGKISFYVSTQIDNTSYKIQIFRLGWYQGLGGRLMLTTPSIVGRAQGYYDANAATLVNCKNCLVGTNPKQPGLIEAQWTNPYTVTTGSDWLSGIYVAKFTDISGWQTYTPFDVRPTNQPNSTYIAVTPDTTYAAYNDWGGASLYTVNTSISGMLKNNPNPAFANALDTSAGVARVSFDKPYSTGGGASDTFFYNAQMVHWMERNGYDVSYMSDVDLHERGLAALQTHKAYISLGHDEYWTTEMRNAVQSARDNKGMGLAFMGANAIYWHMRFETDSTGKEQDRTVVCYKVSSGGVGSATNAVDLNRDPDYTPPTVFDPRPASNALVGTVWRDMGADANHQGLAYEPEQMLVGEMQSDLTHTYAPGFPWQVSKTADPNSIVLKGTGLVPGQTYGCGLVGYEWDNINPQYPKPDGVTNVHLVSESPIYSEATQNLGVPATTGDSTYYVAPSGAFVFATGSFYFTSALDSYRSIDMLQNTSPTKHCGNRHDAASALLKGQGISGMGAPDVVIPGIQTMMQNVMKNLITKLPGNS